MVDTEWSTVVLVCRECAKRTGPENHPSALRKWLRKDLRGGRGKVRVVESSCLDVCPKRGVTVAVGGVDGALVVHSPREWAALAEVVEVQRDRRLQPFAAPGVE